MSLFTVRNRFIRGEGIVDLGFELIFYEGLSAVHILNR